MQPDAPGRNVGSNRACWRNGSRRSALQRRYAGFERLKAKGELLILLARCDDHVAQNLDLFLPGDVHVSQKTFDLALDDGLDLAPDALRGSGRVGHETGELVEKTVGCRCHGWFPSGGRTAPLR